ncbi:multifunctional methyltransferase subunit TRM112-like protein [Parus major]|uniref:multifunctional methyltransferase subunit TRM112-like protein n=1 Tax=Parus major TaxID=9157 RepID=UPI0008F4F382|nr:multifunctional methyltransferase subunit TRM112-like protein [Parus major]
MKLLTHNLLSSHVPGLRPGGGFPLRIEVGTGTAPGHPRDTGRGQRGSPGPRNGPAAFPAPGATVPPVPPGFLSRSPRGSGLLPLSSPGNFPPLKPRHPSELPPEPLPNYEGDEEFLRRVHHVLLEVEVLEGSLQCPDSGRRFPISKGVPNLLLSEDEA